MEKMERKKINLDLIILAVAAVAVLVLYLCYLFVNGILIKSIDADKVERITFGSHQLDEAQTEEFIKIYNSSKYYGTERNFDTTPDYCFNIELDDGRQISVAEYGYLFIISSYYDGQTDMFHVTNNKLDAFVEDLRAS